MIKLPGIWSLWDMLRLHADVFVVFGGLSGLMQGITVHERQGTRKLADVLARTVRPGDEKLPNLPTRVAEQCRELGLSASAVSANRLLKAIERDDYTIQEFSAQLVELEGRIRDEMAARICLVVEPGHVGFYTKPDLFGSEVSSRFPAAIVDIEEAGKCYAVDRGTACVFHLMRVMEVGLQALATKLGVALATEKNWQVLLNAINGAIKRLPASTADEKKYLGQCSDAAIHLQHVKDAWRNDVMHPRESYSPEQAAEVFVSAKTFMKSLAEFV